MKDREARERVEWVEEKVDRHDALLYGRTVDSGGASVFERLNRLEAKTDGYNLADMADKIGRRLAELEARREPVEKDCPVCGHVTLMKAQEPPITPVMARDDLMASFEGRKTRFYCYTCGKTFKESSKTTLEEVKDEG